MTTHAAEIVNKSIPLWVKLMLIVAGLAIAAGLIMPRLAAGAGGEKSPARTGAATMGMSAESPSGAGGKTASSAGDSPIGPAVFRLGFSFFVGFAVAYAARWAFKIALLVAGLLFLALLGLQYGGIVNVQWGLMEKHYDGASRWLSENSGAMTTFVTGALPSAAAGGLGLFAGLRRKLL